MYGEVAAADRSGTLQTGAGNNKVEGLFLIEKPNRRHGGHLFDFLEMNVLFMPALCAATSLTTARQRPSLLPHR